MSYWEQLRSLMRLPVCMVNMMKDEVITQLVSSWFRSNKPGTPAWLEFVVLPSMVWPVLLLYLSRCILYSRLLWKTGWKFDVSFEQIWSIAANYGWNEDKVRLRCYWQRIHQILAATTLIPQDKFGQVMTKPKKIHFYT